MFIFSILSRCCSNKEKWLPLSTSEEQTYTIITQKYRNKKHSFKCGLYLHTLDGENRLEARSVETSGTNESVRMTKAMSKSNRKEDSKPHKRATLKSVLCSTESRPHLDNKERKD